MASLLVFPTVAVDASAQSEVAGSHANGLIMSSDGWDLVGVDPEGHSLQRLLPGHSAMDASWSPDGRRFVFETLEGDLASSALGREDVTVLTDTEATEEDPAWSPDGTRIAFVRDFDIWVIDADGGNETRVTAMCCNSSPSWSPDGSSLVFTRSGDGDAEIFSLDLARGEPAQQLTDASGTSRSPDWSPDGDRIVFVSDRGEPSSNLWVMDRDGSDQVALTGSHFNEYDPAWSPDGQFIAYSRNGLVAAISADGGTSTLLGSGGEELDWQPLPPCTMTGTPGPDELQGTSGPDVICAGAGDDTMTGGAGDDVLVGQGGDDTIAFSDDASAVEADLQTGRVTGQGDDFALGIENAVGTNGADTLRGNLAANHLVGGDGDDALAGDAGADQLVGGDGSDQVVGIEHMFLDLAAGTLHEFGAVDTLIGIENALGRPDRIDVLRGDAGPNVLDGGGSTSGDWVRGRGGDDILIGPATAEYRDAPGPVTVDLISGVADGAGHDILVQITSVEGSRYGDHLTGPPAPTRASLAGLQGDDVVVTNPMYRIAQGGAGHDTITYTGASSGLSLNLATGEQLYDGLRAFARNFEDVTGTPFDDRLIGTAGSNTLTGGAGADVIDAREGTDRLVGGPGNDRLVGRADTDDLVGGSGEDIVDPGDGDDTADGGPGRDRVTFGDAVRPVVVDLREMFAIGQGADSILAFENVLGSAYEDVVRGNAAPNVLHGAAGRDVIYGRFGDDLITGGAGVDSLDGGDGSDLLRARDGQRDVLDGGRLRDRCRRDPIDTANRCP